MERHSENEDRVWESQCRLPTTVRSLSAVRKLRAMPPDAQTYCIAKYALRNLPHLLRCALTAGVSPDTRWGENDTPVLCLAAERGNDRALEALLVGRANVALADSKGLTAAHWAAYNGHASALRLLLDAGAPKDAKEGDEWTPLHLAAQEGHAECCLLLITSGCCFDARNNNRGTPLQYAARKGHLSVIRLLLDAGANANAVDSLGNSPLMGAISHKHAPCVEALLPVSDLLMTNQMGRNAFHRCMCSGNDECFELLLPLIGDVDVRTVQGVKDDGSPYPLFNVTPLHLACSFGQHEIAKALLRCGALRTARDSKQQTALNHAARAGHLSCVAMLLGKHGSYKLTPDEVNSANVDGWTPLHAAAFYGHSQICGKLLAAGARLDAVSSRGSTPLMLAQQEHPANTVLLDLLVGRGPAHPPGTVCDGCGRAETEVRLCTCDGCLVARYCGNACAKAAWPAHKAECKRLQAAREARSRVRIIDK